MAGTQLDVDKPFVIVMQAVASLLTHQSITQGMGSSPSAHEHTAVNKTTNSHKLMTTHSA